MASDELLDLRDIKDLGDMIQEEKESDVLVRKGTKDDVLKTNEGK